MMTLNPDLTPASDKERPDLSKKKQWRAATVRKQVSPKTREFARCRDRWQNKIFTMPLIGRDDVRKFGGHVGVSVQLDVGEV